jgi:hypothetical protein
MLPLSAFHGTPRPRQDHSPIPGRAIVGPGTPRPPIH